MRAADIQDDLAQILVTEEQILAKLDELAARVPLGLGTPSDVGSGVVYLASPAARWVPGQTSRVSGGLAAS